MQHGCGKESGQKITQVQLGLGHRGKTIERLTGLEWGDTTLDLRWTKGLSEPSYSQILTKNVGVMQKIKQGLARRAFPPSTAMEMSAVHPPTLAFFQGGAQASHSADVTAKTADCNSAQNTEPRQHIRD